MNEELIKDINESLEITLPDTASMDMLKEKLTAHINHLINTDFEKLVYYLYRIDVDENKMRTLLSKTAGENAAAMIATLIIERQLQKMQHRKNASPGNNITDEEKW
jgi:hypothetical protein